MNDGQTRATFFRCFSVLVSAGISLSRSLELLNSDLVGAKLGRAAKDISRDIKRGSHLPVAMKAQAHIFSSLQISLLELACETGSLVSSLEALARHAEEQSRTRQKLQVALTYPGILLTGCLLFVCVVPALLFQQLFALLQESEAHLPWYTTAVIGLSKIVSSPSVWLGGMSVALLLVRPLRRWYRKPRNQLVCTRLAEATPWLGHVVRCARLSRFSEALTVSVRAGLQLDRALLLACTASGSRLLKDKMPDMAARIRDGQTLTETLASTKLFPSLFIESIKAGEESGQLDKMCPFLAKIYAAELDYSVEQFTAILEPAALLLMGGIVAVLALSCIQPLSNTLNAL